MIETVARLAMEHLSCGACGIAFAAPSEWVKARREDHKGWHCPNGHNLYFPDKTDQEKRIEALEKERASLQRYNASLSQDYNVEYQARKQVQRNLAATKGVLTKTRKRIASGVCPCCTRSFTNLHRHMQSKHPDFAEPTAEVAQ